MKCFAADTETTGLSVWSGDRPFAVSVTHDDDSVEYWEWPVDPFSRMPVIPARDLRTLNKLFGDTSTRKVFWNARFDVLMLESISVEVRGKVDEVMFKLKACMNNLNHYKLKPTAKRFLGIPDDDEKELHDAVVRCRRSAKRLGWSLASDVWADYWMPAALAALHPEEAERIGIDPHVCEKYAIGDTDRTIAMDEFCEYGMDDLGVRHVYDREMRLWPHVLDMERRGVAVDVKHLAEVRSEAQSTMESCLEDMRSRTGRDDFNPNSPPQVARAMFEGEPLSLKPLSYTDLGNPKTDAEVLMAYRSEPFVDSLLRYRANSQALKNFFNKYDKLMTDEEGCYEAGYRVLHPGFRQWGTITGRFSCSDPNLQNVSNPKTTNSLAGDYVVDVRGTFVPRPGYVWYCPDYDQVEVIIFADVSNESALLEAIRRGDDIHSATAEKIWGAEGGAVVVENTMAIMKSPSREEAVALVDKYDGRITDIEKALDVKVYRKRGKSVTFTKIFGGGPSALMHWIGCSRPEAVKILGDYDSAFPGMMQSMREIESKAATDGYVENLFGRRLSVDRWSSYRAVNYIVQSSAADLMKIGMTKCAEYLWSTGLDARIVMTVHDELVFEFRKDHARKKVLRKLCEIMADHGGALSLPTPVSMDKVVERWSETQEVRL